MEEWKDINGYEGLYMISNFGRVKSLKRNIILKDRINGEGYKYVALYKNKKIKQISVHRLVAIHFIPNLNKYTHVDHIDTNRLNNNVSNLRWCTQKENINNINTHKKKINRKDLSKPTICLTDNKIFPSASECARFYDIPVYNIIAVCGGKRKMTFGKTFKYYI